MTPSLLTFTDWAPSTIKALLSLAQQIKSSPAQYRRALDGKAIVALFEKPSLRTRVSFDIGIHKLGGHLVYLDTQGDQLNGREDLADVGANLSCWADAIVARVFSHQTLETLQKASGVPIVNALCDHDHPCQALSDFLTLSEVIPDRPPKLGYVGDANNVSNGLMRLGAQLGADVRVITPSGHAPDDVMVDQCQTLAAQTGGTIVTGHDLALLEGVDALYTDTWLSMGDDTPLEQITEQFQPYQLNEALLSSSGARYVMHCQPAHRDLEITGTLIDSDHSLLMQQAENRMHAQNAILLTLLTHFDG